MVYRIYVEKKPEFAQQANALLADIRDVLGIESIEHLQILNRYDVENVGEAVFSACRYAVFAEPQTDLVYDALPDQDGAVFAVEYLPGQYDQRADAAAQCVALLAQTEAPIVRTASVYLLAGAQNSAEVAAIKRYVINPVEAREATLDTFTTLAFSAGEPAPIPVLKGFTLLEDEALCALIAKYALAMDLEDLKCCRAHFRSEGRDPTLTELKLLDTYWSDHCRHTTFLTELDAVSFFDERAEKTYQTYLEMRQTLGMKTPVTLMDLATIVPRWFKANGMLNLLDDSSEINACTVKTDIEVDGKTQPWLVLFKNETHNHPTEIEPFGGAATCIGGAIRDPLSGRAFVYQAMRLTGASDPRTPFSQTLPGKLPQRKIVTTAASGYSSYGNQIGLATGLVDEVYHEGFRAKRMEIGAVLGAAPAENVRRETPAAGDVVLLLGGKTGRDGCGGATGSSKAHDAASLSHCGAEVQKGNAPEERKLQRLFRNPLAAKLIKRCNDFGAGGVSVAIGELADGVSIDLDKVPVKYEGLDGTELAISESQERMAVVCSPEDAEQLISLAEEENLLAVAVAVITSKPRLSMRWRGERIVDIPRSFIDSNGAKKHAQACVEAPTARSAAQTNDGFIKRFRALVTDLNVCSKRGLSERFDSTVGAYTVLMPFGGARQLTPAQVMAAKFPLLQGETNACTLMSWGYDPYRSEASPYSGGYAAVVDSLSKLTAAGAPLDERYLTFQEYFGKPGTDPARWGKPVAALLGALEAQMGLGVAAIGGKDSMSGSFERLDVPPTLVSFAVAIGNSETIVSPEFKRAGSKTVLLCPKYRGDGLPEAASLKQLMEQVHSLIAAKRAIAVVAPGAGGVAEAVFKMCLGNGFGFRFDDQNDLNELFRSRCGMFVAELSEPCDIGIPLGVTTKERVLTWRDERAELDELEAAYEGVLEDIFPTQAKCSEPIPDVPLTFTNERITTNHIKTAKPRVLIPVFPGTNCEYESARAVERAGAIADMLVLRTLSPEATDASRREFAARLDSAQALFLPGGFSNGDEPDGSGKFITAFLRNPLVAEALMRLLNERDGLALGVCNGFQALIKLGLLPYGRITEPSPESPTLTFNTVGRHQSRLVRTRVTSDRSPWLTLAGTGEVYTVPVSHGEGRFLCAPALLTQLAQNGQIAAQYVDENGVPSMDVRHNPNGSFAAVEAITSPDGRILGKMGHSERIGTGLYQNVPGVYDIRLFESAVLYFS
ncbi:MAG TPA: phosphoribosylformylglycinamidine synthase [Feifaniaceae bacterium]|nr:phosphoribosylformylglycinamidine synthase [Feifaniaceae bacterium]